MGYNGKIGHSRSYNSKIYRQRQRLRVLKRYGGDPPKCACCGEWRLEFLSIDHVNGGNRRDGTTLVREPYRGPASSGYHTYAFLDKQPLLIGFRVLCLNCNISRGNYGYCPHELEKSSQVTTQQTIPVELEKPVESVEIAVGTTSVGSSPIADGLLN